MHSLHSGVVIYSTRTMLFAARNNTTGEKEEEAEDTVSKWNETSAIGYDDEDDEIDEFEEVMKQLEPKYRRYANWRI